MKPEIIVALDGYTDMHEVLRVADKFKGQDVILKIGKESHLRFGYRLIKQLVDDGHRIFLDLKLHDIPNTVAASMKVIADMGVWMTNVHCSGGAAMMQAAVDAVKDTVNRPLVIGVTCLTSLDRLSLFQIGIDTDVNKWVSTMAVQAYHAGLDGVVCSPHEVGKIKQDCGERFLTVTPGIRWDPADITAPYISGSDDQRRTMTPLEAQATGTDYIVIGRPITQHPDPGFIVAALHDLFEAQ